MADRWVKAAELAGLPDNSGTAVRADGLSLALFRSGNAVYALEDVCPHLGFPLSEGIVRNGEVICAWHGWHVRLFDGGCFPERNRARTFAVEIRGDEVWVLV